MPAKNNRECAECGSEFHDPPSVRRLYCSRDCHDEAKKFTAERFWKRVDVRGANECWIWLAGLDRKKEYGRCHDGERTRQAHDIALELTLGRPLGNGMLGLHSCDNPPCCNPAHLREGTVQDNSDDSVNRNRTATGSKNGSKLHPEKQYEAAKKWAEENQDKFLRGKKASDIQPKKLTEQNVIEIRRRRLSGETVTDLARVFEISTGQASRIINKKRWAWLEEESK